ncbi:Uncharacterised protein [Vibrio alginolyticus]|nr:Uncharacterised protein [Vibrio alginolyticus]
MNLAHAKVGKNTKSVVVVCANKAFKADSQRLAFLVCFEFSVFGTMV